MDRINFARKLSISIVIASAALFSAGNAMANVIVDPKGHDPVQLDQDMRECRELANSIEFNMASEHQGRSALRGAAAVGGMAAIAGGGKEARRRSAAAGALGGALVKNKAERVDGSVEEVKVNDTQRNCLIGRGYMPLS